MITILTGDCIEQMKTMPEKSVQCVVTSPPYWGLRDYKTPPVDWEEVTFAPMPGLPEVTIPAWTGHLGLEPDPMAFVGHITAVFREVKRVLRKDGTLWLNFGDSYASKAGGYDTNGSRGQSSSARLSRRTQSAVLRDSIRIQDDSGLKEKDMCGIPWRVAFALQADGWYLRSDIIWHKPNPMPESVTDRPTKSHEYIFLLTKSERYYYDAEAVKEPASPNTNPRRAGNGQDSWKGSSFNQGKTAVHQLERSQTDESRKLAAVGSGTKNNSSFDDAMAVMPDVRNKRSVWTVPSAPYKEAHFATYPPDLIKPCILAGSRPGDMILDPFGGSGTSGQVANELGRNCTLIELNPEYVKLIERRTDTTPGLGL